MNRLAKVSATAPRQLQSFSRLEDYLHTHLQWITITNTQIPAIKTRGAILVKKGKGTLTHFRALTYRGKTIFSINLTKQVLQNTLQRIDRTICKHFHCNLVTACGNLR